MEPPPRLVPVQRAVTYLAGEVSRWRKENGCFSCHNNGDAARALMAAERQGYVVPEGVLRETLEFLAAPDRWDENNKGDPAYSDRHLARVQFAAALVTASELGYVRERDRAVRAAHLIAELQSPGGEWRLGPRDQVGAPATYGWFLGTRMALRTLRHVEGLEFREPRGRARSWFRRARAGTVPDAAAVLMELGTATDQSATTPGRESLELIRRAQGRSGGWGPYVGAPPEVFDTSIVLIALAGLETTPELTERIARGRAFLLARQEPGGGWPETTRPSGSESYAQHISTTGWATLALLAVRE